MTRFHGVAAIHSYISQLSQNNLFSIHYQPEINNPMFSFGFIIFVTLSLISLLFISFSFYKKLTIAEQQEEKQQEQTRNSENSDPVISKHSLSEIVDETHQNGENNPTHLTHSLLLEVLPSDSPKCANLFGNEGRDYPNLARSGQERERDVSSEEKGGKKKKKRAKKKRVSSLTEDSTEDRPNTGSSTRRKQESLCFYPFTSSSSAMQRKIKQQYDELVKCHESKKLSLAQVGQFANSLVDARSELQHKADIIQRKFTITKALLFKADRSSFDRLSQQIYKLELEQKRLEEDASVYNWLQQQLKLSPAYKKMLEVGARVELKAKSGEPVESTDADFTDISFEELLAQEKKDSFWQKNGKSRLCST